MPEIALPKVSVAAPSALAGSMQPVIEVNSLSLHYGKSQALKDISFDIGMVDVLGANLHRTLEAHTIDQIVHPVEAT